MTISSVNSVLDSALSIANGIVGERLTDEFSHVATTSDALTILRDSEGNDLGLTLTDSINVSGRVGGVEIDSIEGGDADPYVINVDDGAGESITYGDFAAYIKDSFNMTNQNAVEIDGTQGNLIINADGGIANEITAVNITTDSDPSIKF